MVLSSSEKDGSNRLQVCANLNSYLFDYQRVGVEFLYSAYQRNTGAVLGDDMGLGKTIQVIAFLSAILGKHGDHRDKDAWKALLHQRRERYANSSGGHPEDAGFSFAGEVAPIFIVMPASLLQNWEQELRTWMSCSTIILRGKPSDRDAMIDQIARYRAILSYVRVPCLTRRAPGAGASMRSSSAATTCSRCTWPACTRSRGRWWFWTRCIA
jgi:SNF2 family DNA or RNA helicase